MQLDEIVPGKVYDLTPAALKKFGSYRFEGVLVLGIEIPEIPGRAPKPRVKVQFRRKQYATGRIMLDPAKWVRPQDLRRPWQDAVTERYAARAPHRDAKAVGERLISELKLLGVQPNGHSVAMSGDHEICVKLPAEQARKLCDLLSASTSEPAGVSALADLLDL